MALKDLGLILQRKERPRVFFFFSFLFPLKKILQASQFVELVQSGSPWL